jgi:hypothetical protein
MKDTPNSVAGAVVEAALDSEIKALTKIVDRVMAKHCAPAPYFTPAVPVRPAVPLAPVLVAGE